MCRQTDTSMSERVRKNSPSPGFDPQTVHVASRYTDYTVLAQQNYMQAFFK
jgi:hypothetical protein